jgi:signal transduction histidine kinase
MQNMGELIVQAPFPKTGNVLEQLHELTGLEFAWFHLEDPSLNGTGTSKVWILLESTIAFTSNEEAWVRRSLDSPIRVGVPSRSNRYLLEGKMAGESVRLLSVATDSERLLVIEPARQRGDGWMIFALPLITGILSSIGIAIVAAWTASRLSDRIEDLRSEVARIAEGEFEHPPASGPEDDIRMLQTSIHSMGEQLEESQKQIARNERSRLIHMLGSGLAHELRNHLTGARLALQTIPSEDPNHETLGIALKQLDLAESQIKRLLAVRSPSGGSSSVPMKIEEINRTVLELVGPMAMHRSVSLDVFPPMDDKRSERATMNRLVVPAGQSMVNVLLNLLVNAIEAVGTGGNIRLEFDTIDQPSSSARWRVLDDGPGPSPEIAASMFEPFASTKPEGVGLGLAMCLQIVQSVGGTIRWGREDDKTLFEVMIPLENIHVAS